MHQAWTGDLGKLIVLGSMLLLFLLFIVRHFLERRNCCDCQQEHRHGIGHKHGSWVSIDYFAYSSKLKHWNPAFKILLSVLTIVLCVALNNIYVSIIVIFSMAYLVIELGGLALHDYLSVLTIPLTFIVISIAAIIVDFAGHPVGPYSLYLGLGYIYTTPAMLLKGLALMFKVIGAVSALQLMILTTPSTEIISVMKKLHLPQGFIDLMNMIYRYIFILLEVFGNMKNAAESRLGYRDFKTSCYSFGGVASNLLVVSLKKAGAYYDAMEARCYDGELLFLEEEKEAETKLIVVAAAYILYLLLVWFLTQ
jgi:cobalt/nickel transport system permease protein